MTQEERDRAPGPFRLLRRCAEVEPWAAATIAVLMLGLGVWYGRARGLRFQEQTQRAASTLADSEEPHTPSPAYPLPDQPLTNQSVPPCIAKKGEVEIKGGCWIELPKKLPCFDDQAVYEGKCYLPVMKKPTPQSVTP